MNGVSLFVGATYYGEVVIINLGGAALSLFTPVVAVYLIPLRVGAGIVLGCMMQNISAK